MNEIFICPKFPMFYFEMEEGEHVFQVCWEARIMRKNLLFLAGKFLTGVADVFATAPCVGRMYELEVPEMLRK